MRPLSVCVQDPAVVCVVVGGSLGGAVARMFVAPLERAKILIQTGRAKSLRDAIRCVCVSERGGEVLTAGPGGARVSCVWPNRADAISYGNLPLGTCATPRTRCGAGRTA
jgi:hypothetical protein